MLNKQEVLGIIQQSIENSNDMTLVSASDGKYTITIQNEAGVDITFTLEIQEYANYHEILAPFVKDLYQAIHDLLENSMENVPPIPVSNWYK